MRMQRTLSQRTHPCNHLLIEIPDCSNENPVGGSRPCTGTKSDNSPAGGGKIVVISLIFVWNGEIFVTVPNGYKFCFKNYHETLQNWTHSLMSLLSSIKNAFGNLGAFKFETLDVALVDTDFVRIQVLQKKLQNLGCLSISVIETRAQVNWAELCWCAALCMLLFMYKPFFAHDCAVLWLCFFKICVCVADADAIHNRLRYTFKIPNGGFRCSCLILIDFILVTKRRL